MIVRRLVAYAIDWYLISFAMNLVLVVAAYATTGVLTASLVPLTGFDGGLRPALFLILLALDFAYFCLLPRYVLGGQTPGKRLLGVRVVRADGTPAGLGNYALRELAGIVVVEGCFSPLSNYLRNVLLLWVPRGAIQVLVWAGVVLGEASVGFMLITRERRMIHDLIGGTRVIAAPKPAADAVESSEGASDARDADAR